MVKKNIDIEVPIIDLTDDALGIAMVDSQTCEVPFVVPGDKAIIKPLRKRGGVWQTLLQKVTAPSSERITPRCTHFTLCGGCRTQHFPYEKQLKLKEKALRSLFQSLLEDHVTVNSIVPCSPPWNYRNKMELTFSENGAKERFLGLVLATGRGRAFHLTECHLCPSWCVIVTAAVRAWWEKSILEAFYPPKNRGSLRSMTLRDGLRSGDRMVILNVSGNPDYALKKHELDGFVEVVRKSVEGDIEGKLSIFLRIQQTVPGKPTQFYEMQLYGPDHIRETLYLQVKKDAEAISLTFMISPQAFFQPNTKQAEKLYSLAMQLADIPDQAVVYDLYCGTGTLGICAARYAKQVIGIELSPEAVLDARENAKINGLSNVTIIAGDVGTELKKLQKQPDFVLPDVVLVDPPRVGLDVQAIACLSELKPKKIVYISCNPKSQRLNIDQLMLSGYRLTALQPVDQFPHTLHVENIAILERS